MVLPKSLAGVPLAYVGAALVFGLICAFGIGQVMHQPPSVQVEVNQYEPLAKYTPVPAPPAAITTVPTQEVKYNVENGKQNVGKFDPAPPPVVVTTLPMPTPTPEPVVNLNVPVSGGCACDATMTSTMASTMSAINLLMLGIAGVGTALAVVMLVMGNGNGMVAAIMTLIVGITMFFVGNQVISAMMYAMPCVC